MSTLPRMRVTVCQFEAAPAQLAETMTALAEHLASERSEFVLLPELPFSDWLPAEPIPDPGRWQQAVDAHDERIAALGDLGVDAVAGTRPIVNGAGSRRNQAFVWTRTAGDAVGVHEKYYLPDEAGYWEHRWYDRGLKAFDSARVGPACLGFQICTEMWFFEWARHYARSRVDLLCVPRATPRSTTDKWLAGGRVAAVCGGAYCLSSNHWTEPGVGPDCGGVGWIIDPEGAIIATTDVDTPFVTADVDLDLAQRSRSTYPRDVAE